jgi:hypothetical protein
MKKIVLSAFFFSVLVLFSSFSSSSLDTKQKTNELPGVSLTLTAAPFCLCLEYWEINVNYVDPYGQYNTVELSTYNQSETIFVSQYYSLEINFKGWPNFLNSPYSIGLKIDKGCSSITYGFYHGGSSSIEFDNASYRATPCPNLNPGIKGPRIID